MTADSAFYDVSNPRFSVAFEFYSAGKHVSFAVSNPLVIPLDQRVSLKMTNCRAQIFFYARYQFPLD